MRYIAAWLMMFVALFLGGCGSAAGDDPVFYYTQRRICAPLRQIGDYGFSDIAKDTGILIPGLGENFVPQGIALWQKRGWILLSGYFAPLSAHEGSAIFAVDGKSGRLVGHYGLTDGNGRAISGHFSGVAVADRWLYVTGDRCLYRVPVERLEKAGRTGMLETGPAIPLALSPATCNFSGGLLWVAEHGGTPLSSGAAVPMVAGYGLKGDGALILQCVFTAPERMQGITALADGRLLVSCSYGRKNPSRLCVYEDPRGEAPQKQITMEGTRVPFWALEEHHLQSFSAPPMAEGCCAAGTGALLIFESAAYFYHGLDPQDRSVHPTDTLWYLDIKLQDTVKTVSCSRLIYQAPDSACRRRRWPS